LQRGKLAGTLAATADAALSELLWQQEGLGRIGKPATGSDDLQREVPAPAAGAGVFPPFVLGALQLEEVIGRSSEFASVAMFDAPELEGAQPGASHHDHGASAQSPSPGPSEARGLPVSGSGLSHGAAGGTGLGATTQLPMSDKPLVSPALLRLRVRVIRRVRVLLVVRVMTRPGMSLFGA
jgi:hypothetical protein